MFRSLTFFTLNQSVKINVDASVQFIEAIRLFMKMILFRQKNR